MKRYIQLAKHYADYRKFCDVFERLCAMHDMFSKDREQYGYNPMLSIDQEMLQWEFIYAIADNPALAQLAIDFKLHEYVLRRYPGAWGIVEVLHQCVYEPKLFRAEHIDGRD